MAVHISLVFLITFIPKAVTVLLQVECQWQPYQEQFPNLFSLDIFKKNTSLVHLSEGERPVNNDSQGMVEAYSGAISKNNGFLNATLNLPCDLVAEIECELFGRSIEAHGYLKQRFQPKLVFDVSPANPEITQTPVKETYVIGDVILITCSTQVGINISNWRWTVQLVQQRATKHTEFRPIPEGDFSISTIVRSECSYQTTSKYAFIPSTEGEITLQCETGSNHFARLVITVGGQKEYLSTNLFLSSFLVYIHFIVLPTIFGICGEDRIAFRRPDRRRWRTFRTLISLSVGVTFCIWWVIVIDGNMQDKLSYAVYAIIEILFIFFYTSTRFTANLSRCFEKRRQRYLYNSRVATSYGAVMTPLICWAMIKCHGGTSVQGLEIFFWIVSILSFLGFVCVSKNREETYWEIVEKSES